MLHREAGVHIFRGCEFFLQILKMAQYACCYIAKKINNNAKKLCKSNKNIVLKW